MTQIEDLVRQALAQTPAAPASTDPLAALDRRVRRARRRLAVAAGAVTAAVAAAVVVPLAVLGDNGKPSNVGVVNPPTPKASAPTGTTTLWDNGAIWVSTADRQQWLLYTNGPDYYVGRVADGSVREPVKVQLPADYVVTGENVVWVVGGGDGGPTGSRLTAIDTRTGDVVTRAFDHVELSYATTAGDSLYIVQTDSVGQAVDRVDLVGGAVSVVASKVFDQLEEIVTTSDDHVWVHTAGHFVELVPDVSGFHEGASARWGGQLNGPAGRSVWTYADNRLDCLDAVHEDAAPSLSQGCRLYMGGDVGQAVGSVDTGLFVSIVSGLDAAPDVGIGWFDSHDVQAKNSQPWGPTAYLSGVQVITMARDPAGGVDYVDDQGQLVHWDPAAGSR